MRALASLEGAQDVLDDRDQARAKLLAALSEAIILHERRHAEAQHGTKHNEATALEACDEPLEAPRGGDDRHGPATGPEVVLDAVQARERRVADAARRLHP